MSASGRRPTAEDFEIAADWLEDAEQWSAERRREFLAWLDVDPVRLVAVERLVALSDDPMLEAALRGQSAQEPGGEPEIAANDEAPHAARHAWRWAAGLAALALGGAVLALAGWRAWDGPQSRFHTQPGAAAVEQLADGSVVHLDPASDLTVQLQRSARELSLDAGRGLFAVAHDPARPFTVHAAQAAVTAVGTVFSVDRAGSVVTVRVEQGKVRVITPGEVQFITAGQGLVLVEGQPDRAISFAPNPLEAADPHWLSVSEERLDSVIARLSRQSGLALDCASSLGSVPVSGRFRLDDPLGTLRLLALANGWQLVRVGAGWRVNPAPVGRAQGS